MKSLALILALSAPLTTVYTEKGLEDGIVYFDAVKKVFLKIDDNDYIWGYLMQSDYPDGIDIPQHADKLTNCSEQRFSCKSFSVFMIVRPRIRSVHVARFALGK